MRRVFGFFLFFVAVAAAVSSCRGGGRVIPVRKMEKIYREMFLADQWLAERPDKKGMADTTRFYEPIFEKYGFTLKDYQASVDYYLNDPKRYAEMIGRVEDGLKKDLNALDAKIELEDKLQHEADSIVRAWKSVRAKPFRSFLGVFEVDAMTDRVGFEKDSLGVYRPVPVVEDTVFHGPRLVIRDTTGCVPKKDSVPLVRTLDQAAALMPAPVRDIAPRKSVKRMELTPVKGLLIRNE